MKTNTHGAHVRSHEHNAAVEHLLHGDVTREPWNTWQPQRWHADMHQTGIRLVGERMAAHAPPPDVHAGFHANFSDMRAPAPERVLWQRMRQAYAVLRGRAYARPVRQPRSS